MQTLVKSLGRLALLTTLIALTSAVASAQTTGTVTINGSVQKSASLRWHSFTPLNSETGTNNPNTQNSALLFTLDLGDVSPANTNNYAGGTVQVILRTNAAYTLSAQVTASSGFGSAANGDITLADLGFGMGGTWRLRATACWSPAMPSPVRASRPGLTMTRARPRRTLMASRLLRGR